MPPTSSMFAPCCPTLKETGHATSKTRRNRARQAQESLRPSQGIPRPARQRVPHRQGSGDEGGAVRLPRPPSAQAPVSRAVDCRVDAGNPQRAKLALALTAVAVGVLLRL